MTYLKIIAAVVVLACAATSCERPAPVLTVPHSALATTMNDLGPLG